MLHATNASMLDINHASNARAESVPPNIVCTNQSAYLPRAQSEQPNYYNPATSVSAAAAAVAAAAATSPFRQYNGNNNCQAGQLYQRNMQSARLLRHNQLLNTARQIVPPFYEPDNTPFPNNYISPQNLEVQTVLSNKDPNSSVTNTAAPCQQQQQQQTPPILMHHNNNTAVSNNANINNLHQQNAVVPASAALPTSNAAIVTNNNAAAANNNNSRAFNAQVPALNNQVPPGNRANNYWDNFRR